jgi:hypothetical protein
MAPAKLAPLSPGRFALQVTLPEATRDKLRYAQDLLGHAVPSGDVAQVLDRALDALIHKLERRKFAAAARPRPGRRSANPRHVPAAVRRAVWQRDRGQCSFVSASGHRCEARRGLVSPLTSRRGAREARRARGKARSLDGKTLAAYCRSPCPCPRCDIPARASRACSRC